MTTNLITITGPVGNIEAQLDLATPSGQKSTHPTSATAILCHPHPQYGGSMHDPVVHTAANVCLQAGINSLRFNFRGVGKSEHHRQSLPPRTPSENRLAETDDLLAVAQWLKTERQADLTYLIGYSFGAHVVWSALTEIQSELAVLIAPANARMTFTDHSAKAEHPTVHAIAGDRDEFVDVVKLNNWPNVTAHSLAGADHFFSGSHPILQETLEHIILL